MKLFFLNAISSTLVCCSCIDLIFLTRVLFYCSQEAGVLWPVTTDVAAVLMVRRFGPMQPVDDVNLLFCGSESAVGSWSTRCPRKLCDTSINRNARSEFRLQTHFQHRRVYGDKAASMAADLAKTKPSSFVNHGAPPKYALRGKN